MTTSDDTGMELRARQLERAPIAIERAKAKVHALASDASVTRLVRAAQAARTTTQRVVWMHRAASAWAKHFEPVAACRKGCSHCCHQPIAITRIEAQILASASGRKMAADVATIRPYKLLAQDRVEEGEAQLAHWPVGTACSFLEDDQCSAYEARPTACRTLLNLDDDELLCRHSAAGMVQVPYADARQIRALALGAQVDLELADIRDFFR